MSKSLDELYPSESEYYRASDIKETLTSKIVAVTIEEMKDKRQKVVLTLEAGEKRLVVNKTNIESLRKKFGDDYTKWTGKTITIGIVQVNYAGQSVPGIRVIG